MSEIDPASVLGPEGAVARRLQHFESRPQQLKMAKAVASAIEKGRHLMVEAGTGVGKSFAYLVPAIIAAVDLGKKVVVSTHTISLQEQLLNKISTNWAPSSSGRLRPKTARAPTSNSDLRPRFGTRWSARTATASGAIARDTANAITSRRGDGCAPPTSSWSTTPFS